MADLDALRLVGETPLVELRSMSPKAGIRIFAKLEGLNPSGSVKDRIARGIVALAEERGELRPGATIVEATTGNTGIALAMVARQRGYGLCTVLPKGVAPSISDTLELLGVETIWGEPRAGMKGCIDIAMELAKERGYFPLRQFTSEDNVAIHYQTTGAEILSELPDVDVFVAGIGTGGTIMGAGRRLREANPAVRIIGVEPRVGEKLQGLRSLDEGYIPPLVDLSQLSGRYMVGSAQALIASREVALREGLVLGASSGATLVAALRVAEGLARANIVIMSSDAGWKYLPSRPWEAAATDHPELDEVHWW